MMLNPATVRVLQADRRWTTSELARRLDVPRGSLANILLGRRQCSAELLVRIASAIGVPPLCLVGPSDMHAQTLAVARALGIDPADLAEPVAS